MQNLQKYNRGYRYILNVIDLYSGYVWSVSIKNRTGKSIVEAFSNIIKNGRKPSKLWVDNGTEFYNNAFQKWLYENNIEMYSTFNEGKAVVIERFNRTLKNKMYKYFTAQNYGGPYRSNKIHISKTLAESTIHLHKRNHSQKTQNTHRKHKTLSETKSHAQKTQYTHRNENTHRKRKTQYTHRKYNTLSENTIHQKRKHLQKTEYTHRNEKTRRKQNTLTKNRIYFQYTIQIYFSSFEQHNL